VTDYSYDPSDYLTSTLRSIQAYVTDQLHGNGEILDTVDVEMSFPDTRSWQKPVPLERSLVHFELDDDPEMRLGFGVPTTQEDDGDTTTLSEPALHQLNFDVGVWTSAQSGGTSKRSQLRQALYAIFGPASARQEFTEQTGLVVRSYGGGGDVLDRIGDVPVYRTAAITLVISVFSKHLVATNVGLVTDYDQAEQLSVVGADGSLEHVSTDEDPWT
jgi:hypothetical protein